MATRFDEYLFACFLLPVQTGNAPAFFLPLIACPCAVGSLQAVSALGAVGEVQFVCHYVFAVLVAVPRPVEVRGVARCQLAVAVARLPEGRPRRLRVLPGRRQAFVVAAVADLQAAKVEHMEKGAVTNESQPKARCLDANAQCGGRMHAKRTDEP